MDQLNAGELRYRVKLQQDTGTGQDERGQEREEWVTKADRWAGIKQLGGDERMRGGQVQASSEWEITFRTDEKTRLLAAAGWRIVKPSGFYAGTYNVVAVTAGEMAVVARCRREN